ncbi:type II secretion system protein [Salimicrobium halophilum]|uniref:Type IV pilus assembly protein PilA n=1 Tax=Salimicrobium halophilum TaxID=86666 RepID=A0A1G8PJM6_9BACI|nr:prepilin-type N-terminal cleavage/methylation domain-containing protein [Salimicrobium halophilum]SDI92556.1 type IV pilus assembly protein PilA [Salimicrobium halophilum]
MKKFRKILKDAKGFTLVELLAVIVILGIIAAIAVPSITGLIDRSERDATVANAEQMIEAARLMVTQENVPAGTTINLSGTHDPENGDYALIEGGFIEEGLEDTEGNSYNEGAVRYAPNASGSSPYYVYLDGTSFSIGSSSSTADMVNAANLDRSSVNE